MAAFLEERAAVKSRGVAGFRGKQKKRECWVDRLSVYVSMFFFGSFFFLFLFFPSIRHFRILRIFSGKKNAEKNKFFIFFFSAQ